LDSSGNPSIILRNVLIARETHDVVIRINVNRDNINEIDQIVEILNMFDIDLYMLARVDDISEEEDFSAKELLAIDETSSPPAVDRDRPYRCLDHWEYASVFERTMNGKRIGLERMVQMLTPKAGPVCGTTTGRMYVIDPKGLISRCWDSVGAPEESVGSILDTECLKCIQLNEVSRRIDAFSPFAIPQCIECRVLPLCHGGCCHLPIFGRGGYMSCDDIKYMIETCVHEVGTRLQLSSIAEALVPQNALANGEREQF
jgi:uncharacterized protein